MKQITEKELELINQLAAMVHGLARDKGWYEGQPGQLSEAQESAFVERTCNNMHDEVSELHEAWRNGKLHEFCDKEQKMRDEGIEPLTCLEEELADIVIRALDSAAFLGVDIGSAVKRKHQFNGTRPHRHGGKKS